MSGLEAAQVDDYLLVGLHYDERIYQVTRLTDTQVIVGDTKFNKKTGYRVGDSSSWGRTYARLATEEDIKRVTQKQRCRELQSWLGRVQVTPENMALIEDLYANIKSMAKEKA